MKIIEHNPPENLKDGVRVLMLQQRKKDGADKTKTLALRVSTSVNNFHEQYHKLRALMVPGNRIYASVSQRDTERAIRIFRERQLAASYDQEPDNFYLNIEARWISCLMHDTAQQPRRWLFDYDASADGPTLADLRSDIKYAIGAGGVIHDYPTKNGHHIITIPFNRTLLTDDSQSILMQNPMALWAYSKETTNVRPRNPCTCKV